MNAKQSILEKIKDGSFALYTDRQIASKLKLKPREANALKNILDELVREGALLRDSRFRYGTRKQFCAQKGTITGNARGFGFFVPDDGSGDLFIPHRALNGALHGDEVFAIKIPRSMDEGEVLKILTRGIREIVGTFRREKKAGYVTADEKKYTEEIYIPLSKIGNAKDGDKVVASITQYTNRGVIGEIKEVLGESGDFFTEELALIRAKNLREEFPEEVLSEAKKKEEKGITPNDLTGREDLRDELIITIDGEDTRDIDDAISVKKENGLFYLGVHIADVSRYVLQDGALEKEAFRRGTSVYFPDRVLPMLPPALSNGICSLNEGVDRLALSCFMTVDQKGNVLKKRVATSVIRSRHRMTYTAVTAIANGEAEALASYPDLKETVDTAVELTRILQAKRAAEGGVAMDIKEAKILYRDGKIEIPDYERTVSHEMIEQFMVLANESVATLMTNEKMPFVYRIHEPPSPEKAEDFITFLHEAGVTVNFRAEGITSKDYQALLESLQDSPLYSLVNRIMLRSMMKARYSPENLGHFGLASPCYCHFTSPIRRYPDLVVHRILKGFLRDREGTKQAFSSFVQSASERASVTEKNATEAERDVDALYTVAYMRDKVGETYEATVSGVTSYGIYAELKNTVEGFIPVETLPDDYYEFVEERYLLRGTKNSFRLGEPLLIRVDGVDWGMRRVLFSLLKKLGGNER